MHGFRRRRSKRIVSGLAGAFVALGAACGSGAPPPQGPESVAPAVGDGAGGDAEAPESGSAGGPRLRLERGVYAPGDTIVVQFTAPPNLPENAWIGLIPSEVPHGAEAVNDEHDVAFEYLDGRTSGTVELRAPLRPGRWDVRLNGTDAGGRELASATFTVQGEQASGPPRVWLDGGVLAAGTPVAIHFTAPAGFPLDAWIGIVPTTAPHGSEAVCDEVDAAYEHLQGRTSGTVTLTAPDRPGPWDVRMFDTDAEGREVASTTFQVR
ncbi:MAG: hypothetical protein JXB32_25520 [Deltaproteobacteria bacterium]|nr:hypothetical protein [Deltaproteobacteria bacterium]